MGDSLVSVGIVLLPDNSTQCGGGAVEPSATAHRRLLAVHAHPDDEAITTGGLLARCADAGIRTKLVTCADGRYGPLNPELGVALSPDGLAEVRASELSAAARVLGVDELEWLGYHDSGMRGSPHNHTPRAFWSQPFDQLITQMVDIMRQFQPHVVITYDPFGCTGHPDHIQAHRITLVAVEAAAEGHALPDTGPPWTVGHVYYPVFPRSAMQRFILEELRAGRPHPFEGRAAVEINYTRPDETVTHHVDIANVHKRKRDALYAHRTQVGPHYPQLYRAALARREHEHFRLALDRSNRSAGISFNDIFEPVSDGDR